MNILSAFQQVYYFGLTQTEPKLMKIFMVMCKQFMIFVKLEIHHCHKIPSEQLGIAIVQKKLFPVVNDETKLTPSSWVKAQRTL